MLLQTDYRTTSVKKASLEDDYLGSDSCPELLREAEAGREPLPSPTSYGSRMRTQRGTILIHLVSKCSQQASENVQL